MIIIVLYGNMLVTGIRKDKRKNGRKSLDRRRRETGLFTGILNLKPETNTSFILHREALVKLEWLGRYGDW